MRVIARVVLSSGLAALALASAGCGTSRSAQASDRQVAALEAENRQLASELPQKRAEAKKAFLEASEAESAAGLAGATCTAVSAANGPPPASGAVHAKLLLHRTTFVLVPKFPNARADRGVKVANGTCEVGKR